MTLLNARLRQAARRRQAGGSQTGDRVQESAYTLRRGRIVRGHKQSRLQQIAEWFEWTDELDRLFMDSITSLGDQASSSKVYTALRDRGVNQVTPAIVKRRYRRYKKKNAQRIKATEEEKKKEEQKQEVSHGNMLANSLPDFCSQMPTTGEDLPPLFTDLQFTDSRYGESGEKLLWWE